MSKTIRLLIVDDHPVVRDGLNGMLSAQADFSVVGEAGDGAKAVLMVKELAPDVVLMDLRMPEMDGTTAIQKIRKEHPGVFILVLTTYDSDAEILKAIEAGATGYILKDAPREELFRAVRSTAQGQSYLSPSVATRIMGQLREPEVEPLSPRELDVLSWVAKGATNKEIGRQLHISEATVKSHLIHIYEKLDARDRAHAVGIAVKKGLLSL